MRTYHESQAKANLCGREAINFTTEDNREIQA